MENLVSCPTSGEPKVEKARIEYYFMDDNGIRYSLGQRDISH